MNKQRDSITIRKKIMIGTFLVVIVLVGIIVSCYSGDTTFQLLKPSREVLINNKLQNKLDYVYVVYQDYYSVKFINDSTSVWVFAKSPRGVNHAKMNYIDADMEIWGINGFTAPTQENMLNAFQSYGVDLDDYQIDQIDSLSYNIIRIHTNDTLRCNFSETPETLVFNKATKDEVKHESEFVRRKITHTCRVDTMVNTYILNIHYSYTPDSIGVKIPFTYLLYEKFGN